MVVTISNVPSTNGTVQFNSATYSGVEGGTVSIGVTRSGGSSGTINADCETNIATPGSATQGVDYTWVTSHLTWVNGESGTKFCTMFINQDFTAEGSETANIVLDTSFGGSQITAIVTISDTGVLGGIQFANATYTANEIDGSASILLTRTSNTGVAASVVCSTTGVGTAVAGVDYTPINQTVSFGVGATTGTCTVPLFDDFAADGPKTMGLQLSSPVNASLGVQSTATLNIIDNESPVATITSVSPASGPTFGGQPVIVYGTNLAGATSVSFGGAPCIVNSSSYSQISCTTTAHIAGTVNVVATVAAGTATGTLVYTYGTGPIVTGVSPNTGPASGSPVTFITITGANFTNATSVRFGATSAAFTVVDDGTISAILPAHAAGTVDVTVTTPAGTSPNTVNDNFTYIGSVVPAVTGVSPSSGKVGSTVTITGSGFTDATGVTFGGVSATFTVNSDTSITATVPSGTPAGTVDVRVSNANGTSSNTSLDNFTNTTSTTTSYTLYFRWTLIAWNGADNTGITSALQGSASAGTNNIYNQVTSIWLFDGPTQKYKGWFPGGESIPGAVDITTFRKGQVYWIAISTTSNITWTIVQG